MRVARIGSLVLPVPAEGYGGTERSMAQMTLLQAAVCAHDIVLYASSDSQIVPFAATFAAQMGLPASVSADGSTINILNADGREGHIRLRSAGGPSLGLKLLDPVEDEEQHRKLFAQFKADEAADPFDVIHCHTRRFMRTEIIPSGLLYKTLVHQHNAGVEPSYAENPYPLICISHRQAACMKALYGADVVDVIHHGLDSHAYRPTVEDAGYLAWIGRFLVEKGAHRAIDIAQASGKPLILAGTIFDKKPESEAHFRQDVLPRVDLVDPTFLTRTQRMSPNDVRREIAKTGKPNPIIFCGMADEPQKQALFGNATATLFPISWEEPFGRVLIESMACGTPVVGYSSLGDTHCGSVAEVVHNGKTGYAIAAACEATGRARAVEAVALAGLLDRSVVRNTFDQHWTSLRVARQLDVVYESYLLKSGALRPELLAQKDRVRHRQGPSLETLAAD